MPELLEVETYRQLAESALGRPIASVASPDAWFLKGAATGPLLRRVLVGRRFVAARRIGKLLLMDVDVGPTVGIRFGMTGSLLVDGGSEWTTCLRPPAARTGVGPVELGLRGRRLAGGQRSEAAGRGAARPEPAQRQRRAVDPRGLRGRVSGDQRAAE